jgi:hypothetical protein
MHETSQNGPFKNRISPVFEWSLYNYLFFSWPSSWPRRNASVARKRKRDELKKKLIDWLKKQDELKKIASRGPSKNRRRKRKNKKKEKNKTGLLRG